MAEADELRSAFQHLLRQLEAAGEGFTAFAADDAVGLARGYQHLGRQLVKGFEEHLLRDTDHPFGRVLDDRIRTGGNPDQRYLFAPTEAVRRTGLGPQGSAARIELQLYSKSRMAQRTSASTAGKVSRSATTAPLRWGSAPM